MVGLRYSYLDGSGHSQVILIQVDPDPFRNTETLTAVTTGTWTAVTTGTWTALTTGTLTARKQEH